MYTQCPNCGTSFRVTADVLKQAAGKVRCGGCGSAFNALAYLSESKPETESSPAEQEPLPELRPDPYDGNAEDAPPEAISPEQSAALLKTLDQLAGEDIRLEDTGIEWRLLDDDDQAVDEVLDDSPTPVDQFLTDTPNEVEAGEVFDRPEEVAGDIEIIAEADAPPREELRFDDNTGLPEDFDFDKAPEPAPPAPEPEVEDPHPQVDLALGDPDEWGELLSEAVETSTDDDDSSASILDELEAIESELPAPAADTASATEEDAPPDIDTQFDLQAEALGIEISDGHDDAVPAESDQPTPDRSGDTSIEEDLMSAAFEAEQAAAAALEASGIQLELGDDDEPSLIDDLSALDDDGPSIEEELAALDDDDDSGNPFEDDEPSIADELIGRDAVEPAVDIGTDFPDSTGALEFELERAAAEADVADAPADDPAAPQTDDADDIAAELALLDEETDQADAAPEAAEDEPVIPPATEEEQTINAMIDQDLMRMAIEDEDGFASTIVFEKQAASTARSRTEANGDAAPAESAGDSGEYEQPEAAEQTPADGDEPVEAIVMEGSFARTADEQKRIEASTDEQTGKPDFLAAAVAEQASGGSTSLGMRIGMIAGVVVLLLGLGGQFVHQSRAELATIPAVNDAIGPIYQALGMPITPSWDVAGWRFEVTRGSTGELTTEVEDLVAEDGEPTAPEDTPDDASADTATPEVLTIYSRIGNQSEQPLPYPLISVALTDRFEETIGNVVLDPADYLTGDADPDRMVAAGQNFDAIISIESPSMEATGFKLNVCYRQSGELLRCAIEDFK